MDRNTPMMEFLLRTTHLPKYIKQYIQWTSSNIKLNSIFDFVVLFRVCLGVCYVFCMVS